MRQPEEAGASVRAGLLVVVVGLVLGGLVSWAPTFLWAPIAAVVLSAMLAVFNTRRAVQLAVLLVPWQIYLGNWAGSTYTFRLVDIVVGCSLIVSLLRFPRSVRLLYSIWLLPLLLFLGLGVVSGLLRGDLYDVGKFIVDWWPSIGFYWLLLIWAPRFWPELIGAFLLSFSIQAVLAIVQTLIGDVQVIRSALSQPIASVFFEPDFLRERLATGAFNFIWQGRVFGFGTYLSAIGLGVNLAASGTVAWAFAMRSRRLLTSRYLYLGILMFVACVLVLKRSGWVGMGVGFFAVLTLNIGPRWENLKRALLVIALTSILAIPVAITQWRGLVQRTTAQVDFEYGRDRVWPVYLRLILQRPVLGYGPRYPMGSLETGLAAQYGYYYNYDIGLDNSYLYLALVSGLPGLLLVLSTAAYALSQFRHSTQYEIRTLQQAGSSGLAAFMIGGIFVVILANLQVGGTFFLLLALARASTRVPANGQGDG